MNGRWSVLVAGFVLAGCSATADVYGIVGNETEMFKGTTTGYYNGTGTMEMQSDAGTKCIGDWVANSSHRGGAGILSCNDGRQAQIQYTTTKAGAGYGYGFTSTGAPVRFYFGMTE